MKLWYHITIINAFSNENKKTRKKDIMIKKINGDLCHDLLVKNAPRKLAYDKSKDFYQWKSDVKQKLTELLKLDRIAENACPLNIEIEEHIEEAEYRRIRFTFESEKGSTVPCYLLVPKGEKTYPLAITIQGHGSGFHNSVGIKKYEVDYINAEKWDFAVQAVKNGFAALAIEQRGMGERQSLQYENPTVQACAVTVMRALSVGRTVLGERVWDISRAIDALNEIKMPSVDLTKIIIAGESGGGTASFYAGCLDNRISVVAPVCAFCSYEDSILAMHHCCCNYIPEMCDWFEMGDLSCLIAPRKFIPFAGAKDPIFPIEGVQKSFDTATAVYEKAGAPSSCKLVVMPKDHYWCKDIIWDNMISVAKELEWF